MRSCRCCGGKTRTFPKQFFAWTPFCGRRIPTWKSRRLPCSSCVRCRRAAASRSVLRAAPQALQARAMRLLLAQLNIAKPAQAHVERADASDCLSPAVLRPLLFPAEKCSGAATTFCRLPLTICRKPSSRRRCYWAAKRKFPELSLRISCRFVKNYEKSMQSLCTFAFKYDTIDDNQSPVRPPETGGR